jgi:P27 family predicted phage terminase small subunit
MGKRGPAPKPTALRVLHGERHRDRLNADEPKPAPGLPNCPQDAEPEVREVWDYTLAQLAYMNVVTLADRDALLVYCTAVVTFRKATRLLVSSSVLIKGIHGSFIRNPLVQIQRDAASIIRAFAQEFGLTPSARSQIHATVAGERGNDQAARYFG